MATPAPISMDRWAAPLNRPVVGMAALPAGHGYWSTQDNCYYYLQGTQWYSSFCVRYASMPTGPLTRVS